MYIFTCIVRLPSVDNLLNILLKEKLFFCSLLLLFCFIKRKLHLFYKFAVRKFLLVQRTLAHISVACVHCLNIH